MVRSALGGVAESGMPQDGLVATIAMKMHEAETNSIEKNAIGVGVCC